VLSHQTTNRFVSCLILSLRYPSSCFAASDYCVSFILRSWCLVVLFPRRRSRTRTLVVCLFCFSWVCFVF
jgi:hypothetical protein